MIIFNARLFIPKNSLSADDEFKMIDIENLDTEEYSEEIERLRIKYDLPLPKEDAPETYMHLNGYTVYACVNNPETDKLEYLLDIDTPESIDFEKYRDRISKLTNVDAKLLELDDSVPVEDEGPGFKFYVKVNNNEDSVNYYKIHDLGRGDLNVLPLRVSPGMSPNAPWFSQTAEIFQETGESPALQETNVEETTISNNSHEEEYKKEYAEEIENFGTGDWRATCLNYLIEKGDGFDMKKAKYRLINFDGDNIPDLYLVHGEKFAYYSGKSPVHYFEGLVTFTGNRAAETVLNDDDSVVLGASPGCYYSYKEGSNLLEYPQAAHQTLSGSFDHTFESIGNGGERVETYNLGSGLGDYSDPSSRIYSISYGGEGTWKDVTYEEYISEYRALRGDESDWVDLNTMELSDWEEFHESLNSDKWEAMNSDSDITSVINDTEWIKKYTEYLLRSGYRWFDPDKYRAYLIYIDEDDIPELIVWTNPFSGYDFSDEEMCYAVSYKNEKYSIQELFDYYPSYLPRNNRLKTRDKVFSIGKDGWEVVFNGYTDYSGEERKCFIDNESVSEDEFNKKYEEASGGGGYVDILPWY